ncbi:MAG: urate hydroxylase PuuD [Gemmatimonadales bacterium]
MLDPHLSDWLNLALRWFHLIVGIGWIGSSFYFIWLDSALRPLPLSPSPHRGEGEQGGEVEGELWMTHSGGFYKVERRRLGPGRMPAVLHWFKWEALLTWISGMLLLALIYYFTGGAYLLDPAVSGITLPQAIGLSLGVLLVSWLVYDALWSTPLAARGPVATVISWGLLALVVYGLCRTLSGRAAYYLVGAMLGTLMVANVWLRILPAQQAMIDATAAGREPDQTLSGRAKRRSVHNSYMTFPVLLIMLSNHFPGMFGHPDNWIVLGLLIVIGAGLRHVMIAERRAHWILAPVGAAAVLAFVMTAPKTGAAPALGVGEPVAFADVRVLVAQRCLACHSVAPTDPTLTAPPLGVAFDRPDDLARWAARIRERVAVLKTMPLANKTGMTDAERDLLARWVDQGAPMR